MRNIRNIWFIALKDLRLFITDRLAVGMFILFPFLFIVMFNLLLGNLGSQDNRIVLHMVTRETDGISRQIIQSMETQDIAQLKPGDPQVVWNKDYGQAKADVEAGVLDGFLAFPADFTQGVELGYGSNLEVVANAEATNTRMALNGLAQGIISRISAQRVEMNAVIALMVQQGMGSGNNNADIQSSIAQIFQNQNFECRQPILDIISGGKCGRYQTNESFKLCSTRIPGNVCFLCGRYIGGGDNP